MDTSLATAAAHLDNESLLRKLRTTVQASRTALTHLLVYLGEVDERKLYAIAGYPSLFQWCQSELAFSESEAFKRIAVARAARRFPRLLELLGSGALHLSGAALLSGKLTQENHLRLLEQARGLSKRAIEKMLAPAESAVESRGFVTASGPVGRAAGSAPAATSSVLMESTPSSVGAAASAAVLSRSCEGSAPVLSAPVAEAQVRVASAQTYRLHATLSEEAFALLQQAQAMLRHRLPSGDVNVIAAMALEALVKELERRQHGVRRCDQVLDDSTSAGGGAGDSSASDASSGSVVVPAAGPQPAAAALRTIPRSIKREVYKRDQGRCAHISPDGRRCNSRAYLEYHHIVPFARSPQHHADNISLRCRTHNSLAAQQDFGAAYQRWCIDTARKRRGTPP